MEGIILINIQNVLQYCGWIIFWLFIIVIPPIIAVWRFLETHYNHKGYWLNGVDLERYVNNVPIEVPKEE